MKKSPPVFLGVIVTIILLAACKKSGGNDSEFTWTYRGANYTASFVKARYSEDLGPNIIGNMGNGVSGATGLRFRIHPLAAGLYLIGPGESSGGFVDPEGYDLPTVGILTITNTSGNKLSGTFMLTVGSPGSQFDVSGTISNVPIAP